MKLSVIAKYLSSGAYICRLEASITTSWRWYLLSQQLSAGRVRRNVIFAFGMFVTGISGLAGDFSNDSEKSVVGKNALKFEESPLSQGSKWQFRLGPIWSQPGISLTSGSFSNLNHLPSAGGSGGLNLSRPISSSGRRYVDGFVDRDSAPRSSKNLELGLRSRLAGIE